MWRILVLAVALGCSACLGPRLEGRKLLSDDQEAIPYYLPRPYLLVSRNMAALPAAGKAKASGQPDADQVRYGYQIVYLPDRCNQYGLRVSPGIGTLDATIELEDGWKFVGAHVKTDTKTPEMIEAIGGPIAAAGKALARESAEAAAELELYDLFTGQCVFAWPGRDACAMPASCPARD